jgi:ATP-binding cassette subfamily B protein
MAKTKDSALQIWPSLKEVLRLLFIRQPWPGRVRLVAALACLLLARVANVYVPVLFKRLVDSVSDGRAATLGIPVALILLYGFSRLIVSWMNEAREVLLVKAARTATRDLAVRAFEDMHAQGPGYLLDQKVGGLTERISRGVTGVRQVTDYLLFSALPTLVEIAMVIAVLWSLLSPWFAAVTIVTVVIYVAFSLIVTEWRIKFRKVMNTDFDRSKAIAVDGLLNFESTICFNNLGFASRRYREALEAYESSSVRSVISLSLVNVGQGLIISTGLSIILMMAASGLARRAMTVGAFVMVSTYLLQLFQPLNMLGFTYRQIRQGVIDIASLLSTLGSTPAVTDRPDAKPLLVSEGAVRFENLSFIHSNGVQILDDVSFDICPGTTVAIVGESGAGKTTLGRLLLRFYDPNSGRITVDGQDIRAVTQSSLRGSIGLVSQDTILFNESLRFNIEFGRPGADPADVEAAIDGSRLRKLVASLPQGDQVSVGERGLKISGGERQRVAIARVILKNPPILLLDEATSSLDSVTEQDIMDTLRRLTRGRTTLIIAHRLSTIVDADQIIVLKNGKVIEQGRHAQLVAAGADYATMWRRQQSARSDASQTSEELHADLETKAA